MSELLVLKTTVGQREDGIDESVNTAFIEDGDGLFVIQCIVSRG